MPVSNSHSFQLVKELSPRDGTESPASSSAAMLSSGQIDEEVSSNSGINSPTSSSSTLHSSSEPSELQVADDAPLFTPRGDAVLGLKGLVAEDASVTTRASTRTPSPELDPRDTDLSVLRYDGEADPLPPGTFTEVRRICQGDHGEVSLYEKPVGMYVAVKKFHRTALRPRRGAKRNERYVFLNRRRDPRDAEDASTAIGVHAYLAAQPDASEYLLQLLGIFSDGLYVWLITEFAEGGELLEVAMAKSATETQVQRYTAQLLLAVAYLHRHHIGHRDISLENILLKGDAAKLMDFGLAVGSHSEAGEPLRFFVPCGKPYYMAPECHVLPSETVTVEAPLHSAPGEVVSLPVPAHRPLVVNEVRLPAGAAPLQRCMADAWGYAAQPADVFAVGLCCIILAYGTPPWYQATLSDLYFRFVYHNADGLSAMLQAWGKSLLSAEAMDFLAATTTAEAPRRLTAEQCLAAPWLAEAARVASTGGGH